MRNSSDIFCLNESRTDGMQVFSVNGACPLKANRRRPRQHESFQYGQAAPFPDPYDRGDRGVDAASAASEAADIDEASTTGDNDVEKNDVAYDERSAALLEGNAAPPGDYGEFLQGVGETVPTVTQQVTPPVKKPGKKSQKSTQYRKLNESKPFTLTVSNMTRNPLTGAGMETTEYRKPKKGPNFKGGKWLW